MNTITIILPIIISLLGYPIGLLIAKHTKEELKSGRKWFKLIIFICFLAIIASLIFTRDKTLLFLISSFVFIILLTLASLLKSKRKKKK